MIESRLAERLRLTSLAAAAATSLLAVSAAGTQVKAAGPTEEPTATADQVEQLLANKGESVTARGAKSCGAIRTSNASYGETYRLRITIKVTRGRVSCHGARRLMRLVFTSGGRPGPASCRCVIIGSFRCRVHTGLAFCTTRNDRVGRHVEGEYRDIGTSAAAASKRLSLSP